MQAGLVFIDSRCTYLLLGFRYFDQWFIYFLFTYALYFCYYYCLIDLPI